MGGSITHIFRQTEPLLIGENPLDLKRLFDRVVQELSGHGGTTGRVVTAVSGIEITCDLARKLPDLPVTQLLGGRYRDRIRIYCDCHAGDAFETGEHGYSFSHEAEVYDPEAYVRTVEEVWT
jgi:gluconate/galactonate dehydratase